ncbi:MAG TPA: hypothetical protein PKB06_04440, partial [Actinotalea sp.]|nr:hypothetical protein [Actinotalea sp.]
LADASSPGLSRAQHLLEGRPFTDGAQAVAAATDAGDALASGLAHEAAAAWFERAGAVLADETALDPAGARRAHLALSGGVASSAAGNHPAALRSLTEAIELGLRSGDLEVAAAAAGALSRTGGLWLWVPYGSYPGELLDLLHRLLDALGPAPSAARARVLGTLASGSHYGADREAARGLSAEAVSIARAVGDPALVAEALVQQLLARWGPDDHATQVAAADELVAVTDDGALAPWRLIGLMRRAVLRTERFDLEGADEDVRAAWDLTERRRLPLLQRQIVLLQAARAVMTGELEVAERLLERAAEIGDRTQAYLDDATAVLTESFVRFEQGRMAEVLPALEAVGQGGTTVAEAMPLLAALVLVESGRRAEAAVLVERHRIGGPRPLQWDWLAAECWTAVVVCELGDGLLAVYGAIGGRAPVRLYAGRCALVAGAVEEGLTLLATAAEVSRAHGLRPALARALLWQAAALAPTDAAAAHDLAAEALEVALAVGMRRVARLAERLLGVER